MNSHFLSPYTLVDCTGIEETDKTFISKNRYGIVVFNVPLLCHTDF